MQKSNVFFILKGFVVWRILLIVVSFFAIKYIPVFSQNFFGGKYINYITNPIFWTWANFDGEHYLSIAMYGYKDLQSAFFPAYPIIINFFSHLFGTGITSYLWSGIITSNLLFILSLILLWKVVRLDYSTKIAKVVIVLMLVFPASFFFGAVYTESLFLCSSLLTYYLYRKEKYFLAGFVGILMTLTRLYGVLVIFMILVDVIKNKVNLVKFIKEKIYLIGLSFLGIISYMLFSLAKYNDPFAFYNLQTLVGEHRSLNLVFLPQVFYRYLIKIIPNLDFNFFPVVFTTFLEVLVALLFLVIIIFSFKKIRWDYWTYIVLGFLVPSLTGSFSSLPRYVLVLFPAFIYLALSLEKRKNYIVIGIYILLSIIAITAQMLFVRGYFVS